MTKHYLSNEDTRLERGVPLPDTFEKWLPVFSGAGIDELALRVLRATMREDETGYCVLSVDDGAAQRSRISSFDIGRVIGRLESLDVIKRVDGSISTWEARDASYAVEDCVFVYALTNGDCVKIGISAKPLRRVNQVGLGRADRLTFAALRSYSDIHNYTARKSASIVERYLHSALAEHRVEGEWFDISGELAFEALCAIDHPTPSSRLEIMELLT